MKKILIIFAVALVVKGFYNENKQLVVFKMNPPEIKLKKPIIKVTVTMYTPVKNQCDNTPLITACGRKINPKRASEHKWIAVSRDLLKTFKYGDKVMLSNAGNKNGIYTITDTMNKRFKNKIDILETENTHLYKLYNVILTKCS